jgi:hypothetical protein
MGAVGTAPGLNTRRRRDEGQDHRGDEEYPEPPVHSRLPLRALGEIQLLAVAQVAGRVDEVCLHGR